MREKNFRGYLQVSFAWIFAIVAGVFILSLAIYFSVTIANTGTQVINAKTAKNLGILLNPLESSIESGEKNNMVLPVETRIYNECSELGTFGEQRISVSEKSFNKWPDPSPGADFENKYIFSNNIVEGRKFYLFSKPFHLPFKISDLIYMISENEKYCFVNAPEEIEDEINNTVNDYETVISLNNCSEDSIKACFENIRNTDCDISVNYDGKNVKKNSKTVYFEGDALMYAAIFSDPELYECQLKRLMKRVEQLAILYNDKATLERAKGCNSNLNLLGLKAQASNFKNSGSLMSISQIAEDIGTLNSIADCELW